MTGIQEIQPAVLLDAAARKAAVHIVWLVRAEGSLLMLPMNQILAGDMPPVHRPPLWLIRIKLIEKVPGPLIIAKAVRVVAPAHRRCDVEPRIPALAYLASVGSNKLISFYKTIFSCHLHTPPCNNAYKYILKINRIKPFSCNRCLEPV